MAGTARILVIDLRFEGDALVGAVSQADAYVTGPDGRPPRIDYSFRTVDPPRGFEDLGGGVHVAADRNVVRHPVSTIRPMRSDGRFAYEHDPHGDLGRLDIFLVLPPDCVGEDFDPWPRQVKVAADRLTLHWTFAPAPPPRRISWRQRSLQPGETLTWMEDRISSEATRRSAATSAERADRMPAASATSRPATPPDEDARPHVVILVHGINTNALWQNEIRQVLTDAGFIAKPISYGVFGIVRFLLPFRAAKISALDRVTTQISEIRRIHAGARFSFIGHSFGTYCVVEFLRRHPDFRICRLILCGSVLDRDTPFGDLETRFEDGESPADKIVNDCGTRDLWPIMAKQMTWGYGDAGVFGLASPRVYNRWHDYLAHSDFLDEEFCTKYWMPFLHSGHIVRGAKKIESIPRWMLILARIPLKYVIILFAAAAFAAWFTSEPRGRYEARPGAQGIAFAGPILSDIAGRLESRSWIFNPLDWLRGRRSHVVKVSDLDAIRRVVIRGNFECPSCFPNEALDRFTRQFPACLRVVHPDARAIALEVNPDGVEPWQGPAESGEWKLCKVRQEN